MSMPMLAGVGLMMVCCSSSVAALMMGDGDDDLGVARFKNSDSVDMGAGNDITFTHDGTTGLTIAATPISIDSTGELHLNSTTGDIKFQDGGTDQLGLDMDGTGGEIIAKGTPTELLNNQLARSAYFGEQFKFN